MRALIFSLSALALSAVVSAADHTAEPAQTNANSEDQVDYNDYYRALWADLSQDINSRLVQDLYTQWGLAKDVERSGRARTLQPADTAFFEAATVVVPQLATIEAGIEEQRLADAALDLEVREPFVLGYTFGAAAAAMERHGVERHSPEANSIIIRLTQIVLGGDPVEDCVAIHNASVAAPGYEDGMGKAGDDADRFAKDGERPYRLLPWLGPRLGLRPSSPSR
jgi:hypothetical protein